MKILTRSGSILLTVVLLATAADIKVDLPRPRAPQSAEFSALARDLRGLVGADREIE